jgi:hypothetical protein
VVEVYSAWVGPCKSVVPTLKKLRVEGKDEEQLGLLVIAAEACREYEVACEHKGRSEPLFLVYRNGALKAKVHGVNLPSLLGAISEWHTPLPGQDDLEVRGCAGAGAGRAGSRHIAAGKAATCDPCFCRCCRTTHSTSA